MLRALDSFVMNVLYKGFSVDSGRIIRKAKWLYNLRRTETIDRYTESKQSVYGM